MGRRGQWVYAGAAIGDKPKPQEKREITEACEALIKNVLIPRNLPKIVPTEYNFPVGISGKWHGNKYRFVTRYRSGFTHNRDEEFDAPFVRLEFVKAGQFDISWHRHTGEWFRVHTHLALKDALEIIASGAFGPHI